MSTALRSVAFRFTLGPSPARLNFTREAILGEILYRARLDRSGPRVRDLVHVVDRDRSTVRYHLRRLRQDGWILTGSELRPTSKAVEAYPWTAPRRRAQG